MTWVARIPLSCIDATTIRRGGVARTVASLRRWRKGGPIITLALSGVLTERRRRSSGFPLDWYNDMPRKKSAAKKTKAASATTVNPTIIPVSIAEESAEIETGGVVGPDTATFFPVDQTNAMRVRLYREDESTRKWVLHGLLTTEEASEQYVADRFGGGKWVVQLITHDAVSGKQGIRATRGFSVPGAYNPPTGTLPGLGKSAPAGATAEVGTRPNFGGGLPSGVTAREFLDNALVSKLMDVLENKARPAAGSMEWLGPVLTTLGSVVVAMVERKPTGDPMLAAQLAEMRNQLANMERRPGPATESMSDMVGMIRQIMDVRQDLGASGAPSEDNKDSAMWGMFGKALEVLTAKQGQAMPEPVQQLGAGVSPAAPAAVSLPPWTQLLRESAQQLYGAAQRGDDPSFVAELVSRYVPPHHRGGLLELLQRPDAALLIRVDVPQLTQFPGWLDSVVADLRVEMGLVDDGPEEAGEPDAE